MPVCGTPPRMINTPNITLATAADARSIAEMSRDYIEQGLGWGWTEARVQWAIRDRSTNVAVVRQQGSVLAFGIMKYGDNKAHLTLLSVHRSQRRRGLARALVLWLEKSAATAGIERVQVEVREDNTGAMAFYSELGYVEVRRLRGYYRGRLDAIGLDKRLLQPPPDAAPDATESGGA